MGKFKYRAPSAPKVIQEGKRIYVWLEYRDDDLASEVLQSYFESQLEALVARSHRRKED